MIPRPSIVILDDKKEHLELLTEALHGNGYAALPVLFENGRPQLSEPINTIQILFLDIHLVSGMSAGTQAYATVAYALEKIIAPDNGPYILISWSTYPDEHNQLMEYLLENLTDEFPSPATSARLDKNLYLGGSGNLIQDAIETAVAIPQVTALLEWCSAGRIAAGEVITTLLRLIPKEDRYTGASGPQIGRLLAAIAREGTGTNAKDDLTSAMNEGFGPILMDRLFHSTSVHREYMEDKWKSAISVSVISNPKGNPLSIDEILQLNTMTAISTHDIENVTAGQRGVVCNFPVGTEIDSIFREKFSCTRKDLLCKFADLMPKEDREAGKLSHSQKKTMKNEFMEKCEFRLVGLSAACDHAWNKVPVKKLLLALEMPTDFDNNFYAKKDLANYDSPIFRSPHNDRGVRLIFNWRYYFSCAEDLIGWEAIYRLREPLISNISTTYHTFGFRLGIPNYDKSV